MVIKHPKNELQKIEFLNVILKKNTPSDTIKKIKNILKKLLP